MTLIAALSAYSIGHVIYEVFLGCKEYVNNDIYKNNFTEIDCGDDQGFIKS
ncbi:hypothetical protein [Methanosarcina vacuolata]|uniref:hypothetical protein n=1 Tax=Methanosarcina vacuolata TaxID=2215 RepID=UPI000B036149|nr:hypothetical protein [Methanosarcina vacuolata]